LVGPPNAGKSRLLTALTNATPDVADYPFTTQLPVPGMMPYEDVQVQLVDLPAIARDVTDPWVLGIVRNADAVLIVFDAASDDVLADAEGLFTLLEEQNIHLVPATREALPIDEFTGAVKRALIAATKVDTTRAEENYRLLEELLGGRLPLMAVSGESGLNLDRLRQGIYAALWVIRVYTRAPGKHDQRAAPYTLKHGSTVLDAARMVHADFAANLKFARIWGAEHYDGQMVSREDVLADRDLVEFHA